MRLVNRSVLLATCVAARAVAGAPDAGHAPDRSPATPPASAPFPTPASAPLPTPASAPFRPPASAPFRPPASTPSVPAARATPAAPVDSPAPRPAPSSTCAQDDPVPTPRGWQGWDRSAVVVWEAVEQAGGVLPEIEEDLTRSPPAWWRYPSPLRSEALLEAESQNATMGLYRAVSPLEIVKGDILVRTHGAGVCGKMALVGGQVEGRWITIEVDAEGQGPSSRGSSPLFFAADGVTPLPDTRAFRIRVKKDDTIGHIRELGRDLDHLEKTIGRRPLLLTPGERAKEVVTEKVHDLVDEAWSLVAEPSFDLERRELAGRALVLGAYLGWPAAAASAEAVLGDVLRRSPGRPAAMAARASLGRLLTAEPAEAGAGAAAVRYFATAEEVGAESKDLGFQFRWPLTWRLMGLAANSETGLLANLVTGRVLLEDGHADRGAAVLLSQRPVGAAARASLARDGSRKMFPTAKMKALPAIVAGSRREQWRERQDGVARAGEITTIDRAGVVTFLVLNAPADTYPKLREEYATFVRSVAPAGGQ